MINEIKHLTLTDSVKSIIINKILSGEFSPGERIIESKLAEDLNISRGPVREALRKIENEGIVVCESNKGCYVKKIDSKTAKDTYLIRAYLEMLAVDMCKGKFKPATISKMEKLIQDMSRDTGDLSVAELFNLDEKFHSLIITDSQNEQLYGLWSSLKNMNSVIFLTTYKFALADAKNQGLKHEELLRVIKNGDPEKINKAIRQHYYNSAKNLA